MCMWACSVCPVLKVNHFDIELSQHQNSLVMLDSHPMILPWPLSALFCIFLLFYSHLQLYHRTKEMSPPLILSFIWASFPSSWRTAQCLWTHFHLEMGSKANMMTSEGAPIRCPFPSSFPCLGIFGGCPEHDDRLSKKSVPQEGNIGSLLRTRPIFP